MKQAVNSPLSLTSLLSHFEWFVALPIVAVSKQRRSQVSQNLGENNIQLLAVFTSSEGLLLSTFIIILQQAFTFYKNKSLQPSLISSSYVNADLSYFQQRDFLLRQMKTFGCRGTRPLNLANFVKSFRQILIQFRLRISTSSKKYVF